MEVLEELIEETNRRITIKGDERNQEQERDLMKDLEKLKMELIIELQNSKIVDAKIWENIGAKFYNLSGKMIGLSKGENKKIVEESTYAIKSMFPYVEENIKQENLPEDEKEHRMGNKFENVRSRIDETESEYKEAKYNMYIEYCTKETFSHIQRDIAGFIETRGVVALDLKKEDIENIQYVIYSFCRKCTEDMSEKHSINIEKISGMVEEEFNNLCENVKNMENNEQYDKQTEEENLDKLLDEELEGVYENDIKELENSKTSEIKKLPGDLIL